MSREKEYSDYIEKHCDNVKLVWTFLQDKVRNWLSLDELKSIDEKIRYHDASKRSDIEFSPYMKKFFPEDGEVVDKDQFVYAWNHHQKANPHHWQYWVMYKKNGCEVLEIPIVFLIEMLCDWTAMSVNFKNLPSDWYNDNESDMFLHENTTSSIKDLLPTMDSVYQEIIGYDR